MSDSPASLDQEALEHRLAEVPESILPHIRMGYRLIARSTVEQRKQFLRSMLESVESRRSIDVGQASELLGLTDAVAGDAVAAVSLSLGAVIDLNVTEDDFINSGKGRVFDESEIDIAREIIHEVIERRDHLRTAVDNSSLANAVLPTFRNLSYQIDVRLGFDDDGTISRAVPVAVMYISTDCEPDLWLQASRDDLRRLIDTLKKASIDLDRAANVSLESPQ